MMIKCWLLVLVVDEKGGFGGVKFLGVAFFSASALGRFVYVCQDALTQKGNDRLLGHTSTRDKGVCSNDTKLKAYNQ